MSPTKQVTSYWPFGLLLVVTFFIYGRTINYDFVWDDERLHLSNNPALVEGKLLQFWQKPYEGLYIPVSYTAWGLLYKIAPKDEQGHLKPQLFHAANILLHMLNGLLVFLLIRQFVPKWSAAALGAALFMLHPLQVESVVWVSEFRGLLATAFALGALYAYWGPPHDQKVRAKHYLLPAALFVLALLSKPSVVVLPVMVFIADVMLLHKPWKTSAVVALVGLALSLPIIYITSISQPADNIAFVAPLWSRPLLALDALNFYLMKLFAPFSLSASYGRTPQHLIDVNFIKPVLIMPILVGGLFAFFYKRARPFLACLLLFALAFATVSGVVPYYFQKFSNVADRYIYLSMFPAALALGYLVNRVGRSAVLGGTLLVAFFAGVTFLQVPVWANEVSLWNNAISQFPEQALPYNNRGVAYFDQRRYELAITDYSKALSLDPKYDSAYNNRGNALSLLSRFKEALPDYDKAIELKPDYGQAYYNRSQTYANLGQYEKAYSDLVKSNQLGFNANPAYVQQLKQVMGM